MAKPDRAFKDPLYMTAWLEVALKKEKEKYEKCPIMPDMAPGYDEAQAWGYIVTCPSYKFRPAQKSGPFRVVPDSVCDPHTILLHGVLSIFRNRAMRQLEIIAPRHQLDVLRRSSEACGRDTQNTRVSAPDGVYRRDKLS